MTQDTINKVGTAVAGSGGLEVITKTVEVGAITEGLGLLGQIVIIISAIVALFKKKKPKTE